MRAGLWQWVIFAAACSGVAAQNVRVTTQIVEVPQRTVTEWSQGPAKSGAECHRLALEMVDAGQARIVDTSIVTSVSGGGASAESITELIYPTECEPIGMWGCVPPKRSSLHLQAGLDVRPIDFTAFETRNVGVTLEVSPTVDRGRVDLGANFEFVSLVSMTTWRELRDRWGDISVRFPRFRTLRQSPQLIAVDGQFEWVGVLATEPVAVPVVEKRWLVFVRAEILRLSPKD